MSSLLSHSTLVHFWCMYVCVRVYSSRDDKQVLPLTNSNVVSPLSPPSLSRFFIIRFFVRSESNASCLCVSHNHELLWITIAHYSVDTKYDGEGIKCTWIIREPKTDKSWHQCFKAYVHEVAGLVTDANTWRSSIYIFQSEHLKWLFRHTGTLWSECAYDTTNVLPYVCHISNAKIKSINDFSSTIHAHQTTEYVYCI